ncbi:hypothetical protein ACFQAS_10140 [Halopenitus salinus]
MKSIEELGERWHRIFRTLAAGPRRQLIGALMESPPERSLSLPEAANMPDYRLDPERLTHDLVHHHLPMMERAGFIEWRREPFEASRGDRFEEIAAVLEAIASYEDLPQRLRTGCHLFEKIGGDR